MQAEMGRQVAVALYVVAMAAVIVGVDFAFFRNRFWERLTVNIGICLGVRSFLLQIPQASMKHSVSHSRVSGTRAFAVLSAARSRNRTGCSGSPRSTWSASAPRT